MILAAFSSYLTLSCCILAKYIYVSSHNPNANVKFHQVFPINKHIILWVHIYMLVIIKTKQISKYFFLIYIKHYKYIFHIVHFPSEQKSAVTIPILANPQFKWNASCLEHKYIRWYNTVQDTFILHETKEPIKARYIRGWTGNQGTQYLMKYKWKKWEFENHKTVERFKAKFSQRVEINERRTYVS